jgi:hypothetical protein
LIQMNVVEANERIVERLRYLMTVCRHVLKSTLEQTRADPAWIVHDEEAQTVAVASVTRLKIKGVKPQLATVIRVVIFEQIDVRKKEGGDIFSRNVTGHLRLPDYG